MNIEVSKDNVVILNKKESPHENEYNITECNFTFDEFTDSFQVKRAIFTILSTGEMYEIDIINGKCFTPPEVLKHEYETIKLGVYGYNIEIVDEKEVLKERFSPSYDTFVVPTGSYEEGALSPEIITPSQYDIYSQALQEGLDDVEEALENVEDALKEVSHVDIDATQLEHGASVTITNRNNQPKTVVINDGYTPVKGVDYFTTAEIEEIENNVKTDVINELDFDNTISGIEQEISDLNSNKASKTELEEEATARELADTNLQGQIDAITSSKDVVDIVGTYSDLQNYDTSTLTEDDVIKVLEDSTHNNAMSYYRWASNTWNYIGSEGPFYTKSETDSLLNTKQATIDNSHKLASDLVDDTNQTHKFTSTNEKNTWNAKYDKPSNGIPKSDLVASVQESLNKADTAVQDVSDKEDKSNKVTEINSSSTDTQYPSAKCVYDSQEEQNEHLDELDMIYNAFPTISAENETIQLDNTAKVKFREIDLKGNTSQVVIPEEQGTSVSNTSIYVSDANTDKEHTIEMSGNTYQETTTGKNLANFIDSQVYNYTNGVPSTISQASVISNKTNNSYNIKYGTNSFLGVVSNTMEFEENTDYVFSFNRPYKSNFTQRIHILQVNNDDSYTLLQAINAGVYGTPYTYTYSNTTAKKVAFMISTNNSNPKDETETISEIMVRKSTTSDTYEPYTYGASPNPSYPQNIEVVTGQNDITIEGKNLFNPTYEVETQYDINGNVLSTDRYTLNNNAITIDKSNNSYGNTFFNKINLSSGTYIFSCDVSQTNNTTNQARVKVQDWTNSSSIVASKSVNISSGKVEQTFEVSSNAEIGIMLIPNQNSDGTLSLTNIQLEKSSTATTYEPYVSQTYPINLGNIELCKIGTYQDRIYKQNDKWYLEKNNDKRILDGTWENISIDTSTTNTTRVQFNSILNKYAASVIDNVQLCNRLISGDIWSLDREGFFASGTTYNLVIRVNKSIIGTTKEQINTYLSNNNIIAYYGIQTPTTTEITDTTLINQLNALYNAIIYPITNINTDTSNLLPYIDLHYNFVTPSPSPSRPSVVNVVKGNNTITISNSDNTESQVFPINLGSMELCKIGTYQDYIYENNGNWYLKKQTIKYNLSDLNYLYESSATTPVNRTVLRINNMGIKTSYFSNIFDSDKQNDASIPNRLVTNATQNWFLSLADSLTGINSSDSTDTKVQKFVAYIQSNNVFVITYLATPTDTQITDTTLITQLNNIKKAYSYDTQTNISQTNADKPFIIYAEAIRSLKDVFE